MTNGMTKEPKDEDYEPCFFAWNIHLPSVGYFGISASTGEDLGHVDNHDVAKFTTFSIPTTGQQSVDGGHYAEQEKYDQQFQKLQEKLQQQKKQ
jgi:hypothetical protein